MACAIYTILEMFFKLHVVAMTTKYIKTRDESITVTPTNILPEDIDFTLD